MHPLLRKYIPEHLQGDARYYYRRVIRRNRFSLFSIDHKIEQLLDYDGGFFVELGANDGFTQSNTLYFELARSWRGVLVEPAPSLYLECARRRSRPGNQLFCAACVSFGYQKEYVRVDFAGLMTTCRDLPTDLKIPRDLPDGPAGRLSFGAVARTLSSILDESNAPRCIDLLSLDVEGAELEVLRGVDFDRYRFKVMVIECRNLERLEDFLDPLGYKLFKKLSHHDYLFTEAGAKPS